ncbi:MAG: hypothetical protein AMK71_01280 [Nitrospira bacterium SG8_35_4]|nr:MAG: hypothetical protein AMK71_01280 [Nitrospira bacterium SG8_35_4]
MKVVSSEKMPVKPFQNRTSKVWGDGMLNVRADRRSCTRIAARVQARFFCGSRIYAGDILDISEKGMFLSTDIRLPVNSRFDIMILVNRKVVKIPVTVRRTVQPDNPGGSNANSGMGVELTRSVQEYIDYIHSAEPFHRN